MSHPALEVLVVDDDDAFARAIGRAFKRANFSVVSAISGEEAVELVGQGNHFDAIVTDLQLPGLRGSDLIRDLRTMDEHVAIIFLSGDLTPERYATLRAHGAFECFDKPVDIDVLVRAVRDGALESAKWKIR